MDQISNLVERVRNGDRIALSKLITRMEHEPEVRKEVIKKIYGCPVKGRIICFTGPPGVGKSTIIDHVISILTEGGKKVGVILVDPRSPYTGGSLLGDRIRMQRHATNQNVFIRSISCADNPEGISRSVKDILKVMGLSGMDYIIVETVGTGQIAVEVSYICHTTVLVLMPNMGDDIQMMKAGIIESADIYVINKSDLQGGDLTEAYLRDNIEPRGGWMPPIIKTIGYNRSTIVPLVEKIEEHLSRENPMYMEKIRGLLKTMFMDYLDDLAVHFLQENNGYEEFVSKVAKCECDYYTAVEELFKKFKKEVLCNDKGIDHVAIAVRDMDEAVKIWRDMGFDVEYEIVEEQKVKVGIIHMGDARIEILEPTEVDSPISKFLEKRGEGLHHLAVKVDDIEKEIEKLKEMGYRLIDERPRIGAGGKKIAFVHPKSAKILLELVEG